MEISGWLIIGLIVISPVIIYLIGVFLSVGMIHGTIGTIASSKDSIAILFGQIFKFIKEEENKENGKEKNIESFKNAK